jgi:stress-induced morphogen
MTQTLELTAAELELIENKRKQDILAEEAEKLKKEARFQKESIEIQNSILKEQKENNDQVAAATEYHSQLVKLNPKYKLIVSERELQRDIKDYSTNPSTILKTINYKISEAHITLEDSPFKVEVKKHMVYSGWRSSTDKGYKMELYGGGFYNERLLSNTKTINKKIEDKLQAELNAKVAEQKKASSLDTAYDNLVNKYPEATIIKSTEWERNSYDRKASGETINIITVTLLNKIKIKFKVYSNSIKITNIYLR